MDNIYGNGLAGIARFSSLDVKRNFYLKDHLGSIRVTMYENSGCFLVANATQYAPYGEEIKSYVASSNRGRYKFTEKERDTETAYDYFGARYYNNKLGVWLSVDPLAEKYPGWNPYNFFLNSPIRIIDPDGRGPLDYLFKLIAKKIGGFLGRGGKQEDLNPGWGKKGQDLDKDQKDDAFDEVDDRKAHPDQYKENLKNEKKKEENIKKLKDAFDKLKQKNASNKNDDIDKEFEDNKKKEIEKKKSEEAKQDTDKPKVIY